MTKSRLLRETAEIALTEIKRFIEPHLTEDYNLRRVSAPLFLPVESPLIDPRHPGARIHLPGMNHDVEIVASLDMWLRGQLTRYEIAPGFGVYTIMNALRPELPSTSTLSPHIAAWAWQQAHTHPTSATIVEAAKRLYSLLIEAEKMILAMFPHINATLSRQLEVVSERQLQERMPDYSRERRIYEFLHPADEDRPTASHREGSHCAALFLFSDEENPHTDGQLWTWHRLTGRPVLLADIAAWSADAVAQPSVGGNIYRDNLAMQLLHQTHLLV